MLYKIKYLFFLLLLLFSLYNCSLHQNLSYESPTYKTKNVDFLYDLTYTKDAKRIYEQEIFDNIYQLIDNAEDFIILDLFLFDKDYKGGNKDYLELSQNLTNKLIEKKKENPDINIIFITDPINTFYGVYESKFLKKMKENDIEIIVTNLNKLHDSNKGYSIFWRIFFSWFGTSGKGWLKNPFGSDAPKVNIRGYLKLVNFKANHRKVIITEKNAIITSANPHDPSSLHSNIAFLIDGNILNDLVTTEKAVAEISKSKIDFPCDITKGEQGDINLKLITEEKIADNIIDAVKKSSSNDKIDIAVFYLSDRKLINSLTKAAKRGVKIRIILDPNKDAFGIEKNGIPNRSVAAELLDDSHNKIQIRWYNTHGEQFHTKFFTCESADSMIIIGGSANYTRRNLRDYNLETDLKITAVKNSEIALEIKDYFNKLWNNDGAEFTLDYEKYADDSIWKYLLYRFQEFSGMCTY